MLVLFVFVNNPNFYCFSLKAVLYFQKVRRIDTGKSLLNAGNYFFGTLVNYASKIRTDYEHLTLKNGEN